MNKKKVFKFLKKYVLGGIVFSIPLIFLDFYIEELRNETNDIKKILNVELVNYLDETLNIEEIKSEIILIDFWFSRCTPCLEEMRYFPELLKKYKDRLSIISYSWDPKGHTKEVLESNKPEWEFLPENNKNWHFVNRNPNNNPSLLKSLKIKKYPTYFVIDKQRNVISKPQSGIYGIERELNSSFAINTTFKKHMSNFDWSIATFVILAFYNILVAIILVISFIYRKIKKKREAI